MAMQTICITRRRSIVVFVTTSIILSCFMLLFKIQQLGGQSQCQYFHNLSQNIGDKLKIQNQLMDSREELSDDTFSIPSEEHLGTLDENKLTAIYWRYMNTIQALCRNVFRFGSFRDGGKEICVDQDFRPIKPCLVYSFGSKFKFDFELSVQEAFGCEIHTFDPSMNVERNWTAPGNVTFHKIGLDGANRVTKKGWTMKTLESIMKDLGHERKTLDILKIDIEGAEWSALTEASRAGTLRWTKQLAVETHYYSPGANRLLMLRYLYDEGFRICMRDRNLGGLKTLQTELNTQYSNLNELTFINSRFKTSD